MATSSILADFTIKDRKTAEAFVKAYEAASKEPEFKPTINIGASITDPERLRAILAKGRKSK
jgi:hypothetical protein